jgi:hypothetical protein
MDMVGNVWQWTDEFADEHSRAAILRGGEYYQPQGSKWYFPEAYRNNEHSKLLLMAPGYDRSGGVGFRCVRDAQAQKLAYLNPDLPAEQRASDLVHRMTLEEKATQLENQARAVPRLGVPAYDWWSESLHSVLANPRPSVRDRRSP